jgi:hypothetical protein
MMAGRLLTRFFAATLALTTCLSASAQKGIKVQGWTILSDSYEDDLITIAASKAYNINHLQLSHDLIMDLQEIRIPEKQQLVNRIIQNAHESGIKEVVVWDHALYNLKYYPDKFRTGPKATLNLDDPAFWDWFKQDYRDMLKLVPSVDGLVLTFIETGARAENQYSEKLGTGAEKLAAVVDAVAKVVCDELGKKLYIRTFAYTDEEYKNTIGCISYIRNQKIILMMKETPHDFFLTHPNDKYAGTINRPTIMEFDCGNEFNGQGIVANTWPEYVIKRWSDLIKRPNVIGYVARTDRYKDTRIVGTPNEILLYTLKRYTEDQKVTAENIYDEFIIAKYGEEAIPYLKPAFKLAFEIITSSFYTLGTNVSNHSKMDFDPYKSSYGRHVSGKWLNPPVVYIAHDVNRQFNYWTDIIEHIAPSSLKKADGPLKEEAPVVVTNNWVSAKEMMNEEYLKYIIKEKQYGVKCAKDALGIITKGEQFLNKNNSYLGIYNLFYRSLLTAELYEATATAYFGYRIYARGSAFQSDWLKQTMSKALSDMLRIASEIENYNSPVAAGQWNWKADAETARIYHKKITETGWKEYGNAIFKLKTP